MEKRLSARFLAVLCLGVLAAMPAPVLSKSSGQALTCHPAGTVKPLFSLTNTEVIASAFDPQMRFIYILESTISSLKGRSALGHELVRKINLQTGKVEGTIFMQPSWGASATGAMAVSSNGRLLFLGDSLDRISVINTGAWQLVRQFSVAPLNPKQIVLSQDGETIYMRSWLVPDHGFALAVYDARSGKRLWLADGHFNYMRLSFLVPKKTLLAFVMATYKALPNGIASIGLKTGKVDRMIRQGNFWSFVSGPGDTLLAIESFDTYPYEQLLKINGTSGKIMDHVEMNEIGGYHASLLYDKRDGVLYVDYWIGQPAANEGDVEFSAYSAKNLARLSSITCNKVVELSNKPMAIARKRHGIYVVGFNKLWFIKTDEQGAFEGANSK